MNGYPAAYQLAPARGVAPRVRLVHLALNWLLFAACYPFTNLLAQQRQVRRSFALGLDAAIPFMPLAIVPYATAGVLFTLAFFAVRTPLQLRLLSRRLLCATLFGALVFALLPGRFSHPRPMLDDGLPAALFRALDLVDLPFNQLPSLHVAYCVILWLALRPVLAGPARAALGAWLILVAASAVLTWQHHLLDAGAGLVLGIGCALLIRRARTGRYALAFYYAIGAGVLLLGAVAWHGWLLAYGAASLMVVALTYRHQWTALLHKPAGTHTPLAWLLYWPYLAGYWLTWQLVRLRQRGRPAFFAGGPQLWFGRRLTRAEARQLPAHCHVIDLCTELGETAPLRGPRYRSLPLLDLAAPRRSDLRRVLATIDHLTQQGVPLFVHCAMGYSRSRLIARLHLRKHPSCRSPSTS